MAKTRFRQKAQKTAVLLAGMRDSRVAGLLEPFGFSPAVLEDGWDLYSKATEARAHRGAPLPSDNPITLKTLSEFERRWFPVVRLVLRRRYPRFPKLLGTELSAKHGPLLSVGLFLNQLAEMENGQRCFGPRGPEARAYLRARGLTDEVVANVTAVIERLRQIGTPGPTLDRAAAQAAEKAMWDFYLEWSGLCRLAVTDGNLLRLLGFKKRSGGRRAAKRKNGRGQMIGASRKPPEGSFHEGTDRAKV